MEMQSDQERKAAVCRKLQELGVDFTLVDHAAVYTIEEMEALHLEEKGEIPKNLFLRDAKGKRHILVSLKKEKRVNLKELGAKLGARGLTFASLDRLQHYMGIERGAVTPLGIFNDDDLAVEVVFDRDLLQSEWLGVHPNTNMATLWLRTNDLLQAIRSHGNELGYFTL